MTSTTPEKTRADKIIESYAQEPGFQFLTAHGGKTYAWFQLGFEPAHIVPFDLEAEGWRVTYPTKPEWWDDETEPRCDECGVHTEEADEWDGECGNCGDHCACDD